MIVHSTSWLLNDLLPEIDIYLSDLVEQTNADLALVSSADSKQSDVMAVRYNNVSTKLPSLEIPHINQTSFCLCTINRPIPVIIGPLNKDPIFAFHPIVRQYAFNTYVGVPIVVKKDNEEDQYIGSICLFFRNEVSHDIREYEHISISLKLIVKKKLTGLCQS